MSTREKNWFTRAEIQAWIKKQQKTKTLIYRNGTEPRVRKAGIEY